MVLFDACGDNTFVNRVCYLALPPGIASSGVSVASTAANSRPVREIRGLAAVGLIFYLCREAVLTGADGKPQGPISRRVSRFTIRINQRDCPGKSRRSGPAAIPEWLEQIVADHEPGVTGVAQADR